MGDDVGSEGRMGEGRIGERVGFRREGDWIVARRSASLKTAGIRSSRTYPGTGSSKLKRNA